jgi:hypothetical protein
VLEDKTLIGAMVEIDANVKAFHVIDELGWDCRAAEVAKVGCDFHWLNALFIFFGIYKKSPSKDSVPATKR